MKMMREILSDAFDYICHSRDIGLGILYRPGTKNAGHEFCFGCLQLWGDKKIELLSEIVFGNLAFIVLLWIVVIFFGTLLFEKESHGLTINFCYSGKRQVWPCEKFERKISCRG